MMQKKFFTKIKDGLIRFFFIRWEEYGSYFRQEEFKGERAITWFRLVFILIIAIRAVLYRIFNIDFYGQPMPWQIIGVLSGIAVIYLLLFWDLRYLYRKKPEHYKPFYRYIVSIIDIGALTYVGFALLQILQKHYQQDVFTTGFAFIIVILYLMILFTTAFRFDPLNTFFTMFLAMGGVLFIFLNYMDQFTTSIALGQILMGGLVSAFLSRSMRKKIIKIHETAMLERYLPRELVEEINKKRHDFHVGGSLKKVAVLFSDIRGFTQLVEAKSPNDVIEFLNLYLSEMIDIVFEYKGTLDKFIGDAVMAIYGAPIALGDEPERAVQTALRMHEKLAEFNKQITARGFDPIQIGIGIAYGEVIAGNVGSAKRMDYTVIGDTVNVAARLEKLNKELQSSVLVTESIYQSLSAKFIFSPPHEVKVQGKIKPLKVYQVLAPR